MYYHLSTRLESFELGDKKLFTPRIPINGYVGDYDNIIEDTITPRVCLSPTILGCLIATNFGYKPKSVNIKYIENICVFATKTIPNMVVPKKTSKRVPKNYKGIVPDCDVTKEVWSLDPIDLMVIYKFSFKTKDLFYKNMLFSSWVDEYNRYMPKKFRL